MEPSRVIPLGTARRAMRWHRPRGVTTRSARLGSIPPGRGRRLSPLCVTLGTRSPATLSLAFLDWFRRRPLRGAFSV
jgi:hypothetical protein